jgi:glycosyltransferase involved in cell wall biosynthesis
MSAGTEPGRPLSVLTVTTLFPNAAQPHHGIFVENRLRKLLATGEVTARVLAPVPWLPGWIRNGPLGPLGNVPASVVRDGLTIDHPRFLVVPKVGMNIAPWLLFRTLRARVAALVQSGLRIDLIDAHYFYPDGVAAAWLARSLDLPIVITGRGTDLNLIPQFAIPRRLIRQAVATADGLVTVCEALKAPLVALGAPPDRVTVLRNGVDLDRFRPLDRDAARSRLGLVRRTLGSVGHLIERKGHHHIVRALASLPDTDLLIVGDGPYRAVLEKLMAELGLGDRVRFLGAVAPDRLPEIYNAIDALVLASSREGWANVLLEAMACGTPVIASAVWGTPEVVAAAEAGVLMQSLDADGVVEAARRLFAEARDPQATRRYAERFDWQPTTDGQLRLFRQAIARRTGGDSPRTSPNGRRPG